MMEGRHMENNDPAFLSFSSFFFFFFFSLFSGFCIIPEREEVGGLRPKVGIFLAVIAAP